MGKTGFIKLKLMYILKTVLISFIMIYDSVGQEPGDTTALKNIFKSEAVRIDHSKHLSGAESDIKIIISFTYMIYKDLISSQDIDVCVFEPSCSDYTMTAIEKEGLIRGTLDGLDRLMRCHPMVNKKDYQYNRKTDKYYDIH